MLEVPWLAGPFFTNSWWWVLVGEHLFSRLWTNSWMLFPFFLSVFNLQHRNYIVDSIFNLEKLFPSLEVWY
jgi:hypothetical protein